MTQPTPVSLPPMRPPVADMSQPVTPKVIKVWKNVDPKAPRK